MMKSTIKKISKNNYFGIQTQKLENVLPEYDILPDTYVIHSSGGWHPFSSVPDAPLMYQQNIWPYIERIKWTGNYTSEEKLIARRSSALREGTSISQINCSIDGKGYPKLSLYLSGTFKRNFFTVIKKNGKHRIGNDRKRQSFMIHRLVALAFIPNPENKAQVMHINNNPSNYLIENLKWGTASENMKGKRSRTSDSMKDKYLSAVTKGFFKDEIL